MDPTGISQQEELTVLNEIYSTVEYQPELSELRSEVPRYENNSLIDLNVQINECPINSILDTGADVNYVSQHLLETDFVQELNLIIKPTKLKINFGNRTNTQAKGECTS